MNTTERIAEEPVDPADSLLVAYLDGELDDDQRRELEERLVAEPRLREQMQRLQQSFDMLNELPTPQPQDNFARSTVEMIALTTSQALEIQRRQRPWRVIGYGLAATVAALLVVAISFLFVRNEQEREYAQQLGDLAVVQNLQGHLSNVPPEFLRALARDEQWQQHISRGVSLGELVPQQQQLASFPPQERAVTLASFPTDTARRLKANWTGFRQLPAEKKQEVREHFKLLASEHDADALLATLHEFSTWMESLPPTEAADIRDAKTKEEFIQRAQQTFGSQWLRWTSDEGRSLPRRDIGTVVSWVFSLAEDRYQRLPEDNPWRLEQEQRTREFQQRFQQHRDDDDAERKEDPDKRPHAKPRPWWLLTWGILKRNEESHEAYRELGEYFDGGKSLPAEIELPPDADRRQWLRAAREFLSPTDEEYDRLVASLSPKAQEFLSGLDGEARKEVLDGWSYFSMKSSARQRWGLTLKSLEETYDSLTNEEREELDLLPPEEFARYLRDKQMGNDVYRPSRSRGEWRRGGGTAGGRERRDEQSESTQNPESRSDGT